MTFKAAEKLVLSHNEKAAPARFFGWLLACWPIFSLINSQQSILKFTKHLHKQLTFSASLKANKNS